MKLIVHDLDEDTLRNAFPQIADDDIIITDTGCIHPCIGCFGCCLKTPGACIIKDPYQQMGRNLALCSEILVISKCVYGCYSPFVKNVLDRSISYIHPYFSIRNGEMHHRQRYKKNLELSVIFYGSDLTPDEKEITQRLPQANAVNLYCTVKSVTFLDSLQEMEAVSI